MYLVLNCRMVQAICSGGRRSKWLGIIAVMAVAALILSVVTDVEMTKCQTGSAYAMMRFLQAGQPRDDYLVRAQVSWQL
jgi:hypothetical protein